MEASLQKVSLQEAGRLVGKKKQTVWKACKAGKLSYEKDDNGHFRVDISELDRVWGIKPQKDQSSNDPDENQRLKDRVRYLEDKLEAAEKSENDWKQVAKDAQKTSSMLLEAPKKTEQERKEEMRAFFREMLEEKERADAEKRRQGKERLAAAKAQPVQQQKPSSQAVQASKKNAKPKRSWLPNLFKSND